MAIERANYKAAIPLFLAYQHVKNKACNINLFGWFRVQQTRYARVQILGDRLQ